METERTRPQKTRDSILCWAGGTVLLLLGSIAAPAAPGGAGLDDKHLAVLKLIYAEVKEMGPYPGEDFVRREFFVGEDDDDTNKDVHVVVLIQSLERKETMTVRVTEMVKDPGNPLARLAKNSRMLVCSVAGDRLEVQSSDYQENDLAKLAPEILMAVRNKKRLLNWGQHINFRISRL